MISASPITAKKRIRPEYRLGYRALNSRECAALDAERERVADLLRDHCGVYSLPVLRGDLAALQQLLEDFNGQRPTHDDLEAMGVIFGDVVANELGLEWQAFTSDDGVQPALVTDDFALTLFPRRMLSRCVEDGGEVQLETLLNQITDHMCQLQR